MRRQANSLSKAVWPHILVVENPVELVLSSYQKCLSHNWSCRMVFQKIKVIGGM